MGHDEHEHKEEKVTPEAEDAHKPDEVDETPEESNEQSEHTAHAAHQPAKSDPVGRCWQWVLKHKLFSILVAVVVLLGVLFAVPFTRYSVLGLFLKQDFPVVVLDSQTGKPVSSATITLKGQTARTNAEGKASVHVPVGNAQLTIDKKYYTSTLQGVLVPIKKPTSALEVKLKATGRPVPITVLNAISGQPLAGATVSAEKTQAKTDDKGQATLVVPAEKQELKGSVAAEGFNKLDITIKATTQEDKANSFKLTPAGKIYFLSNASGKIDLIKSDLDGSNRQTVLAGTGKEDRYNTVLFASRDWKYIALLSKRDGGEYAKLFLIEAANDKVTTMDEGDALFDIHGWSGNRLVYSVYRTKLKTWEPKTQALKSYDASAKKITTLLETAVDGDQNDYAYEQFNAVYVLDQEVVYAKSWNGGGYYYNTKIQGKQATLNSLKADGSQKKTIKSYNQAYIDSRTAGFGEVYILHSEGGANKVDEYHDGKVTASDQKGDDFYNETYPSYAVSPTSKKTLWSDYRDGKNVLFVGDGGGQNGQQIGASEDFTPYGWYGDDYILLTKKGSELHIMPANGLKGSVDASAKVSDYYKPNYVNRGFGYGYGG